MGFLVEGLISLLLTPIIVASSITTALADRYCYLFSLFDGFRILMVLISGFDDFDWWILVILINEF